MGSELVKSVHTIGLPIDLKIIVPTRSAVGLDLGLKFDFNKEINFFAIMIGMRIGRIMPKK